MVTSIIWEDDAINDRYQYFEWLYRKNPSAAENADTHIEETVNLLKENPFLGKNCDYINGVRVLIVKGLSLNIFYQEDHGEVIITRILHQSMNMESATST